MSEKDTAQEKKTAPAARGSAKRPAQPEAAMQSAQPAPPAQPEAANMASQADASLSPISGTIPTEPGKCIIVVQGKTKRDDEMRVFRISGKAYTVKTNVPVEVPNHLAAHIMDLADRKKLSAQVMDKYRGKGISLGELG